MKSARVFEGDSPRYTEGIGRRKTSVARVRIVPAVKRDTPSFMVNARPWNQYFPMVSVQQPVRAPFDTTATWGKFDVTCVVRGGGIHAQAGAVALGIARALVKDAESLRKPLREAGMLSRDPREKERKKPGLKRARRAAQWQKR